MSEQPVDTLDYLTDEQLLQQLEENLQRNGELGLAIYRNERQRARLEGALVARSL